MRKIATFLALAFAWLTLPTTVLAVNPNAEVNEFVRSSLTSISLIAGSAAAFFLAKGGYQYITSSGSPEAIESAKKTIRNALIGLVVIIAANTFTSLLINISNEPSSSANLTKLPLIEENKVDNPGEVNLGYVLTEAVLGFIDSIVQTIGSPISAAITNFIKITPSVLSNKIIFNFWLILLGITDSLFALIVALVGLQLMSASTFGFEEVELKKLFPRLGLAFLGANSSIFLIDWIIRLNDTLVSAVFTQAGDKSLNDVITAIAISGIFTNILMIAFIILAIGVLIFYINRLLIIAVGTVLSPLVFLLWVIPKFSNFADNTAKMFLTAIFSTFVHAIILMLGVSFLSLDNGGIINNPILSILMGIGLMGMLLKVTSTMMFLWITNDKNNMMTEAKGQIINVMNSTRSYANETGRKAAHAAAQAAKKGLAKI